MATYTGRQVSAKGLGIGGIAARIGAAAVLGWAAVTAGPWAWDKLTNGNAPIEQGFVNYKALDVEGKKNAAGNMEAILQYKNGDNIDSLPCMKGYSGGVVCGTVDYIVENFTPAQREGVVVGQFPAISNDAKRGIIGGELQAMLDSFYGVQNAPQQSAQYNAPKK